MGGMKMSVKVRYLLAALFAVLCADGCAVPTSVGGYFENRRQDLIDVAHVDLSAANVGAVAYAGPFMVGIDYMTGLAGREQSTSLQIGLGGPRTLGRRGLAAGLLFPASHWNGDKQIIGERPKRSPSGMSVGASAGLLAGVGAEADVLELVDFALGILCVDVIEDDPSIAGRSASPIDNLIQPVIQPVVQTAVSAAADAAIKRAVPVP